MRLLGGLVCANIAGLLTALGVAGSLASGVSLAKLAFVLVGLLFEVGAGCLLVLRR